jgi:anti-sigma factor RsiW
MLRSEQGCIENVELIMKHVDGLLPPALVTELEAHLAGCPACRAELLLQKRIRDALSEELHPRLSIDFTRHVTEKVRSTQEAEVLRRRGLAWTSLVPAVTLAVLTLLMFIWREEARAILPRVLGPTWSALSAAAGWVGQGLSKALAGTGGAPVQHLSGLRVSGLEAASGPILIGLLVLLSVLPVVWCFQRVADFLRE